MISGWSPTCGLYILDALSALVRMISHIFPISCNFALVSHLSPDVSILLTRDFRLVSTSLPLVSQCTLDALSALVRMISHLSPTSLPVVSQYNLHSLPAWFQGCFSLVSQRTLEDLNDLVHMLWHFVVPHYALDSLVAWFQAPPTWFQACPPLASTCLPVHPGCSECFVPHHRPLVSHLAPSCLSRRSGFWAHMISIRMTSHLSYLSPTRLWMLCSRDFTAGLRMRWKLWMLWSAWFRTCLPAVPRYTLDSLPAWF